MKRYTKPIIEIYNIEPEIITSSNNNTTNNKPGHGYGDKNHKHEKSIDSIYNW